MKTLNEYLKMPYRMELVEDPDEGGFVVSYPDLPGCITCGETVERAIANAQDAKKTRRTAAFPRSCFRQSAHRSTPRAFCGCTAADTLWE